MAVPLRVLLIEDNEDDAVLLLATLEQDGFSPEAQRVDTEAGVRDALRQRMWDLVISDYRLPHFSGLAALRLVRDADADVPFIMVSGAIGEECIVEVMRAGAQDFVAKDHLVRLVPAIQRELHEAEIRRERRRAEEQIQVLNQELQRRNAELAAESARWQGAIEGIADEVWVCDAHGRMSLLNLTAVTHMGLKEFQGKTVDEVLEDVDILNLDGNPRPPEDAPLLRSLRGKIVRGEEIMRSRTTGKVRWRQFSASPTRDIAGNITGAIAVVRDITREKEAEEALRESEHDLNRAQAVAKTGSWRLDVRRNILRWSAETYRMFGIPQNTPMTYDTFLATIHPDDREYVDTKWMAALHGEPYDVEHRIIVDEAVKWVRERAELDFDPQGNLLGGFGTVQDITERKLAEEEREHLLNEVQHRVAELDATLNSLADGVFIYDAEGHIVHINETARNVMGYSPEESTLLPEARIALRRYERPDGTRIAPDELPISRARKGEIVRSELVVIHTPKRTVWTTLSAAPIQMPDGRMLGAIVTLTDITPFHQLQEERERLLAEVEHRATELDATLNSIADGVVIYDLHGNILRMNAMGQHMTAYSSPERQLAYESRMAARRMTHADGAPFTPEETPLARVLQHDETVTGEVMVLHSPERVIWLSVTAAPIYTPDKRKLGVIATMTDITALHELQERERRYLYTLAHNLRAPASLIKGNLELLLEKVQPSDTVAPYQKLVDALQHALYRMSLMVDNFYLVSRLEEEAITLHTTPVALSPYIHELIARFDMVLDTSRIQVDIPSDLPPVKVEPRYLDTILLSLLENAQKFSPAQTPISINAHRQDGEVVISVTDQGIGVSLEDIPHIFDRFYRVEHMRKAEGFGLGLYIVKRLVEAHGGFIWVESEVGKGSTFFFTLLVGKRQTVHTLCLVRTCGMLGT